MSKMTSSPLHQDPAWISSPCDPCPGQQCSRDKQPASCGLRAESKPVSQGSGFLWAPTTSPATVLHSSFDWTTHYPRSCAGARGS